MKTVSTKKALFMSVLSLLVCFSMLVGTTFAWFTDSVTSANNIIKSGNLDVKLEYSTDMNTWTEVTSTTNVFKEGANWEPGYTEVVYLRVSNIGSLALKYRLGVYIASEEEGTNKDNVSFKLSDYIEYGIDEAVTAKYADRNAALTAVKDETGKLSEYEYNKEGNLVGKNGTTIDEDVVAMVVYMPEEVGNVANHNGTDIPVINLGIDLFATQDTVESDSFGPDYDNAAWVVANADATAGTVDELNDALEDGGLIALTDDIEGDVTLDNIAPNTILNFAGSKFKGTVTVAEGQSITMNGKGGIDGGDAAALTVGKDTDVTLAGGDYTSENTAIIIANKKTEVPMTLTIEEGTVITAPTIIVLDQMDGYAGANVVINGGEFNSTYTKSDARPIKVHGGNVTINGGTFTIDNPKGGNCYFVDISSKYNTGNDGTNKYIVGNAEINGGTFVSNVPYTRAVFASMSSTHIPGTVVINGGTFEFTADNSYLVDAPANVIVNDCTFIGVKAANVFNISSTNPKDLTITVNGGNYTVRTSPAGCFNYSYADRVILKGGTINSDKKLTDSLADGYKVVDNGNGTYSIVAE